MKINEQVGIGIALTIFIIVVLVGTHVAAYQEGYMNRAPELQEFQAWEARSRAKNTVPTRPFIVIGGKPTKKEYVGAAYDYTYKLLDANNNVFYYTEQVVYQEHPRYFVGDTISNNYKPSKTQ